MPMTNYYNTEWTLKTLIHGKPTFKTMMPYIPRGLNLQKLGEFFKNTKTKKGKIIFNWI